jgi:hypothetical protein
MVEGRPCIMIVIVPKSTQQLFLALIEHIVDWSGQFNGPV